MNTLAKVFIVINLIFGIAFLSVSCVLFAQQEVWKATHGALVIEYRDAVKEFRKTAAEKTQVLNQRLSTITDLKGKNDSLNTDKGELTDELKIAHNDLEMQKDLFTKLDTGMKNLDERFRTVEREKDSLISRLDAVQNAFDAASKQKMAAEDKVIKLTEKATDLAMDNEMLSIKADDLDKRAARMNAKIAKLPADIKAKIESGAGGAAPPINAMVQGVDHDTGYVILSVGTEDDVEVGHVFTVYRDASYIATVQVDKVFSTKCAARIDAKMTRQSIKAGDDATTRLGSL